MHVSGFSAIHHKHTLFIIKGVFVGVYFFFLLVNVIGLQMSSMPSHTPNRSSSDS